MQQSNTDEKAPVLLREETSQMATPKVKRDKKASRSARRLQKKMKHLQLNADEEAFFTECIARAEDERTEAAQKDE